MNETENKEKNKRFLEILESERQLLSYCTSGFVTCTELGMDVSEWLEYCNWKDDRKVLMHWGEV